MAIAHLQFFSQRWNSLSQDEVDAPPVNSFKIRLEKIHYRRMDLYKDFWVYKT